MLTTDEIHEAHVRAAAAERRIIREAFKRPERINVAEWSEKYRYLAKESSPGSPGRFSFDRAPYQREPMEVLSDPRTRRGVLMWASQLGKSLILENVIGHCIHLRPRPMLMVQPKIDSAEGWSKERFAPMIRETPVLASRVRDAKSRSSENTLRMKMFPGGFLAIASSGSPAELAARAVAKVLADEVDRYEESAGTEGDPVDLAERRMATVDDGLLILTSTPGNKGESRIEPAYEAGDQRRLFVPCPHCGFYQELKFGSPSDAFGLKWEKTAAGRAIPETAAYLCAGCAVLIEEKYKSWMLDPSRLRWIAQAPDNPYPSWHLNALYSLFGGTTWAVIVRKFVETKGSPQRLKTFVNTFLAETWEETGERVEAHSLIGRLEATAPDAPVADGVITLTAAVDVQDAYLELWVWGWGRELESYTVFQEQIPGDPGTKAPWIALDEMRRRTWKNAAGQEFSIATGFVDSGGHHTQEVYSWCRQRQRERWYACKGSSDGEGVALVSKPTFQTSAKVMLYSVGVFTAKEAFLRSQLHIEEPGPGFVHLSDWVTLEHLEQFTSEKLVTRVARGRRHREWIKVRDRNEALDCRNYAYAALHALPLKWLWKHGLVAMPTRGHQADVAEVTSKQAGDIEHPSEPTDRPEDKPAPPEPPEPPQMKPRKRRRSSWAKRY